MESMAEPVARIWSTQSAIGWPVAALAVAAMARDHLSGGDTIAFLVTSAVALSAATAIFAYVIPRTKANAASSTVAAKRGLAVQSPRSGLEYRRSSLVSCSSWAEAASRSGCSDGTVTAATSPLHGNAFGATQGARPAGTRSRGDTE